MGLQVETLDGPGSSSNHVHAVNSNRNKNHISLRQRSNSFDDLGKLFNTEGIEADPNCLLKEVSAPKRQDCITYSGSDRSHCIPQSKKISPVSPFSDKKEHHFSFIQVSQCMKTFYPRNETVAIAIFFQPSIQLYETIIIDVVEEKECCRLYTFQNEVISQLRKRKAFLDANKKANVESKTQNMPPLLNAIDQRQSLFIETTNRKAEKVKNRRRRSTAGLLVDHIKTWQQECMDNMVFNKVEVDLDSIDVYNLGKTQHQKTILISKILVTCLKSIAVGGMERKFQLVNDATKRLFTTFVNTPSEVEGTIMPTKVSAKSLINQAKQARDITEATISLKKTVSMANVYAKSATAELNSVSTIHSFPRFRHEHTLNPNIFKWRYKWQNCLEQILNQIRHAKCVRKAWGDLVDQLLAQKRLEDKLFKFGRDFSKGGKWFRRHEARRFEEGVFTGAEPLGNIVAYRQELKRTRIAGRNNNMLPQIT